MQIETIAWLAGSRSCEIWDGVFEEHWSPPTADTIQGTGRHLKTGKTVFMEFFAIEPDGENLILWIHTGVLSKGAKEATPFKLTKGTQTEAIFENPNHDFPTRIAYTRLNNDRIYCLLEGTRNGQPERAEFNFRSI